MSLFGPHSPEPEIVNRQTVIAELSDFVSLFERLAAGARSEAVILTYRNCAEQIERRIDALRRGDGLKV